MREGAKATEGEEQEFFEWESAERIYLIINQALLSLRDDLLYFFRQNETKHRKAIQES